MKLLDESLRVLRPGGVLILEAVVEPPRHALLVECVSQLQGDAREGERLLAGFALPRPQGAVGAAGEDELAVGGEGDAGGGLGVPLEAAQLLAALGVP